MMLVISVMTMTDDRPILQMAHVDVKAEIRKQKLRECNDKPEVWYTYGTVTIKQENTLS